MRNVHSVLTPQASFEFDSSELLQSVAQLEIVLQLLLLVLLLKLDLGRYLAPSEFAQEDEVVREAYGGMVVQERVEEDDL